MRKSCNTYIEQNYGITAVTRISSTRLSSQWAHSPHFLLWMEHLLQIFKTISLSAQIFLSLILGSGDFIALRCCSLGSPFASPSSSAAIFSILPFCSNLGFPAPTDIFLKTHYSCTRIKGCRRCPLNTVQDCKFKFLIPLPQDLVMKLKVFNGRSLAQWIAGTSCRGDTKTERASLSRAGREATKQGGADWLAIAQVDSLWTLSTQFHFKAVQKCLHALCNGSHDSGRKRDGSEVRGGATLTLSTARHWCGGDHKPLFDAMVCCCVLCCTVLQFNEVHHHLVETSVRAVEENFTVFSPNQVEAFEPLNFALICIFTATHTILPNVSIGALQCTNALYRASITATRESKAVRTAQ